MDKEVLRLIKNLSVLAFLILFLPAMGCKQKVPAPPPPPKVTVSYPVKREVTDYLELSGNTQPVNTVQLVARVPGYLDKVFFVDGQVVRKGQLLFSIQQDTYIAGIQQAEGQVQALRAQVEYAQSQLIRYSNLLPEKASSQTDVDNWRYQRDSAKANLKTAEANLELARLNLNYTKISAPFDGRIDRRLQDPGNLVGSTASNTVLAQFTQVDPIYVYFTVSDADLSRLIDSPQGLPGLPHAKQRSFLMGLVKEKGYPHEGYVDFASTTITSTSGTLLMRGVVANPKGKILPGLFARVHVPLEKKEAFLVPDAAISSDQQGSYVLMVDEKNVVLRRAVKTGALVNELRVIEEGLGGKELIVTNGILKASPGRQVTPELNIAPSAADIRHSSERAR